MMSNIGGWLFSAIAFIVFYFCWRKEGYSKSVLIAGCVAIFAHHVLSALNVLYGPFSFAQLDAYSFHLHGIQRVDIPETKVWSIGSDMYKSLLGTVYGIFGKSLWMGQTFSIVFFSLCCVLMMKFSKVMQLNALSCSLVLLMLGLLPSSLLYGSFTLRETFFTSFFILGAYCAYISIYAQTRIKQWKFFSIAIAAFTLMGVFHMVLLMYAIVLSACLFIILCAQKAAWQKRIFHFVIITVVVGILIWIVKEALPVHISDDYFAMLRIQVDGEVVPIPQAISIYHQSTNSIGATTQYDAALEFKTWGKMVFVFMYSYLFYIGWPITGDYSQLSTWVLMAEAIVRLLGIGAMFLLVRQNKQWQWLIFIYLTMTFLWNIGTSNHGQALRHHFMTEWIPVLALMSYAQIHILSKCSKRLTKS